MIDDERVCVCVSREEYIISTDGRKNERKCYGGVK